MHRKLSCKAPDTSTFAAVGLREPPSDQELFRATLRHHGLTPFEDERAVDRRLVSWRHGISEYRRSISGDARRS